MNRSWPALALIVFIACGDASPPLEGGGPDATPTRLEVICHEDGSTEVLNDEVQASSDGVHIRVDNRAGEFASLNGTALDFSEGVTEQVSNIAPGKLKVACWPGSKHRGPEPETTAVNVVDPHDHWVPGELECPRDKFISGEMLDYSGTSEGEQGDPEEITRERLKGLENDDEIFTLGYPDAAYRSVAIERDTEIIGIVSFTSTEDGGWLIGEFSDCDSSGLSVY